MMQSTRGIRDLRTVQILATWFLAWACGACGGVVVGRVDVEPSGGSLDEKPAAQVAGETPDAGLVAGSGNRGDGSIAMHASKETPAGLPMRQADGVIMASLNELLPQAKRGGVEVAGALTVTKGAPQDGGAWVAGFSAEGSGVEANVDFALAFFPFADGWIGGHLAKDGSTILASGNLPDGSSITTIKGGSLDGEIRVCLAGVDAYEDGMLFAVAAANGDNVTAVGPLPDGSGWNVRVADEAGDFKKEEICAWSFIYLPYRLTGLTGGWVSEDGRVLAGTGSFGVRRKDNGRYEIVIPGRTGADGILLAEVAKMNPEGVEDNAIAWAYDATADDGRGAFVVETYDQPDFAPQNTRFYFAFLDYKNALDPRNLRPADERCTGVTFDCAGTWTDSVLAYQALLADYARPADQFRPFSSGILGKDSPPQAVDIAVQGVPRIWLVADSLDSSAGDVAAWGDAGFVMRDGSMRRLRELPALFTGVGSGKLETRPVAFKSRRVEDGLVAQAPCLLGYAVPPDAARFRALTGLDAAAGAAASVEFRIVDTHDRQLPWSGMVRPKLDRTFPAIMKRLREALDDSRLTLFDPGAALPRLRDATASMSTTLGSLAAELPPAGEDTAGVLRRFEAGCIWMDNVARVAEDVWTTAPPLAQVMDYPSPSLVRLRAKVDLIRSTQPAMAGACETRIAGLDACETIRGKILRSLVNGDRAVLDRLPDLGTRLMEFAEWADGARGWTTYRGDNERSATSHEILTWPLRKVWSHTPLAPPAPAWPPPRADNPAVSHKLSPTLTYDVAYHVVAANGRVFYGDNACDAVVCLDARTGTELWRFNTEGPVRLAPVLWSDRVYAACDDGWLYCLTASTGELAWRYRAGPDDTRLPGNQRLISLWPVRCGICIDQGVAYFGAGVYPTSTGAFLCAVDATTGEQRWKQTSPWVPQGFLLLSPTRLLMPTGRTPFQTFDRQTGRALNRLGIANSWGKILPGGTCAVTVNRVIATGPGEDGMIHLFDEKATEAFFTTEGRQVVVDGLTAYVLMRTQVVAIRRNDYLGKPKPERLWEGACRAARTMIKVGDNLVVGGEEGVDVVSALDGRDVGHVSLDGAQIDGLAWHDGRLFASALDGQILCLAGPQIQAAEQTAAVTARSEWQTPPEVAATAREIVKSLGRTQGFALVAGADSAGLAVAIAACSELQCVIADPDAGRCRKLRSDLARSGIPGARVCVHTQETANLPYRPYLFNLVLAGPGSRVPRAEAYRVLRPCGGVLLAADGAFAEFAGRPAGAALAPPVGAGLGVAFRRGALPGAGRWTHGYADPGNTVCSGDTQPFGAYDILWFGRPGPQFMYERHIKGAPPLYDNGLLYVTGCDYLAGVDAYNGTVLWEQQVQDCGRMAMLKDCGNMATVDGLLYVVTAGRCLARDGLSGEIHAEHKPPPTPAGALNWDYIAVTGDLLLGSGAKPESRMVPYDKADYNAVWYQNQPVVTSRQLFALRRSNGATAWNYEPAQGVIVNPTLTVLANRLCFVESTNPDTLLHATGKIPLAELFKTPPQLVAVDLETGKDAWRVPIDLKAFQHAIYMSGKDGVLVLNGTRHDDVKGRKLIQYQLVGIDGQDGRELWRNDNTPSRAEILDGGHGEQTQHPVIVGNLVYGPGFARQLRDGTPHDGWKWNKSPQCAPMSASLTAAFSRQNGTPTVADFATGKENRLSYVSRPGCWINTLPVGGIVAIPEASSGCTCPYSVQGSMAFCPRPPPPPGPAAKP